MIEIYKLRNQIKRYDWGSPDLIPRFLDIDGDGGPQAELWMGSHPGSASVVCLPSGEVSLRELIARDPVRFLGEKAARQYGDLPFLFKLLAVEKPLSIQVHPDKARTSEGFERENKAGIARDAPARSYRDPNHKPEIICALPCEQGTPFTSICGFREPGEIRRLLEDFLDPLPAGGAPAVLREGFDPLLRALAPETDSSLRDFLSALFALPPEVRKALTEYILSGGEQNPETWRNSIPEWDLIRNLARLYPGDPSVIAPLYLNVFRLEPGKAAFLGSGVLHSYFHGFGIELMPNSDNVLRGGLTSKHIDVPELMKVLDFNPIKPRVISPEPGFSRFTYPTPCDEFSLTVIRGTEGKNAAFAPDGPAICIVTDGEVTVSGDTVLKQGESAFIPATSDPLLLQGKFTLYIAGVGTKEKIGKRR
jgi:mannose-6-phosphate isomerase